MGQGLIPGFPLWQNATLPFLEKVAWRNFLVIHRREIARAEAAIARLHIKTAGVDVPVAALSGGNAQKVSIAKWLTEATRVLLLDEPTAGVDIGSRAEILQSIRALAAGGAGVILVSSEFEELLAVSDRVLVLRDGRIVAERQATQTTEHELILLAGGTDAPGPAPGVDMADPTITATAGCKPLCNEMSHTSNAVPPRSDGMKPA